MGHFSCTVISIIRSNVILQLILNSNYLILNAFGIQKLNQEKPSHLERELKCIKVI